MKKLLVLALVLGLISVANAVPLGLELSVGGEYDGTANVTDIEMFICTEIVIDVMGPLGLDYMAYLVIEGDPLGGEWGDNIGAPPAGFYDDAGYPKFLAGAGDMSTVARYIEVGWGFGYELGDAQSLGENPGGTAFEFLYHCVGPDSEYVTITLWDLAGDFTTPEDTIVIHQVPEPMTIALLGLGGLFLLRRRR